MAVSFIGGGNQSTRRKLPDFIIPKLKTKWKIKQNLFGTLLTYSLTLQYSKHVRIHYFARNDFGCKWTTNLSEAGVLFQFYALI